MKAIIWDLDGTLIDSYKVIANAIKKALAEFHILKDLNEISKYIQTHSVTSFLNQISDEYNLDVNILFEQYFKYNDACNSDIAPLPNAYQTLESLSKLGVKHFIYTHKSNIAHEILKNLDMHKFFTKILTIDDGFKRKPDPEAIEYLINTYHLDKNDVYYVGDRSLDIESAIQADIKSILYIPDNSPGKPTGKEDYIVYNLLEVINII